MHTPVMVAEVVEHLEPARGGIFLDCTIGLGGHALALLEGGASRLIGLDRDASVLPRAAESLRAFDSRISLVHADYREIEAVLGAQGVATVDGVLADLGVSSVQLDEPGRGFSFRRDEPLDMRMDQTTGPTAAELIQRVEERELADVIYEFGEERHARRVARAIVEARNRGPVETTAQLAAIVRRAVPRKGYSRIDPATRTFQAIRIWLNRELDGLDTFLVQAARRLSPRGRLAVLSFHSLEDRIVKHTLRTMQASGEVGLQVLTKRPLVPTEREVQGNPRARSAKLRVAERVA